LSTEDGRILSEDTRPDGLSFLEGGGEMGARMRSFEWSRTAVGPVQTWPTSLKTMVGVLLASRFPMLIWWGPELVHLYNDAYRPMLGDKHPASIGASAADVWAEIWHIVGPQATGVLGGGPATWNEDLLLPMNRKGYVEETYFTFSYSAIPGDGGRVGGVLVAVHETTEHVQAQRQLEMLRDLASASSAKTPAEACRAAAAILATNDADVPFALLYLLDEEGTHGALAATVGLETPDERRAPSRISVAASAGVAWPLEGATGAGLVVDALEERFGSFPGGRWGRPPQRAIVLRLAAGGHRYGFLVAGISPARELDDRYQELFRLTAERIATAIGSARAFDEQRRRAEALAEIDRAKTVFFSNISHEFRTPLTLMLGPTEDLLTGAYGELTPAQRAQLELLRRNELRLQRLVNALLEFSRIEAGRSQARFDPVDLAALTRDIASSFRAAIERAGLAFIVECAPLERPAAVDVGMWEQIVSNLLSNAFKFTFEGAITLALQAVGDQVVLQVTDTGVGVRAEDLPRLFERFHRVEGTRARTHEGSGIGLALVHELVRLHGGTIEAESAYGVGTTFKATIPRRADAADLMANAAPRPSVASTFGEEALRWLALDAPPSHGAPGTRTARILVADDNADMRDYLRRILETRWIVEVAPDGEAALDAARERRPDVVLTDVMMPAMDGFRLVGALRADPATRDVPVILLSARAGEESRVEGLSSGADDYLVKPFSARELVARVAVHVDASRLRRAVELERAKLRAVFESVPAIICVLAGPDHVFELANAPYLRLIGDRPVIGVPIRDALPELEGQGYFELLDDVYRTGVESQASEAKVMLARPGGGEHGEEFVNFVYCPRRNLDGAVDGILVFGFVVTEQVVARREIEDGRRAAEAAQRRAKSATFARDEFFSIASHELRTPLTTLGLQIDGLIRSLSAHASSAPATGREASTERWLDKAKKLRVQADRLEQLMEPMLDAVRPIPERTESACEELDLAAVAREVIDRAGRASKRAQGMIELSTEPVVGRWDRRQLERVLTELLSNALKFGRDRSIRVRVEAAEGSARLIVADQGIGIAPDDHGRIFERFERATSAHHFGGFGLGLWVVRELVDAMQGSVDVESEPERGATFVVRLPRRS